MLSLDELRPPLLGMGNDWTPFERAVEEMFPSGETPTYTLPVSIVIPVYNRREKLGKTIAALTHSTYPLDLIEVIIADDGSSDSPETLISMFESYFPITHIFQEDLGYRLSEVRNYGVRSASHDHIIILDCDMLPEPTLVESYMKFMHVGKNAVLIGGRRYVNTDEISIESVLEDIQPVLDLPTQRVDTGRGPIGDEEPSEDWRYKFYSSTDNAKNAKYAFRWLCGGNICFHRPLHDAIGGFDETFTAWGAEDQEYGYRLYSAGAWFIPVDDAIGLHQEPPGGSNETDRDLGRTITREQLIEKCPAMYRKSEKDRIYEVPKITVYIPAYNCESFIEEAVESALNQTFTDLEVVICNDGSTDGTGKLIDQLYGSNPRVVIIHQENGGISSASNTAIRSGRGEYILQLDSDDVLLPKAAESLVQVFEENKTDIGFVYGDSYLIDSNGADLGPAYSWSIYSRKRLENGMMIHHPRMFRRRDFNRTKGFDETISNAVDFDFFLQLSELTTGHHLQVPLYLYRQHTQNTSKVDVNEQDNNTHHCAQSSLNRLGLNQRIILNRHPEQPRKIIRTLLENPDEYRLNCVHLFDKFGFESEVKTHYHRWELDRWCSNATLKRSEKMTGTSERFLRLGPFGSVRVADAVAGRVLKENGLTARVESKRKGKGIGYHLMIHLENQTDKEAVELRRYYQDEHQWKCEILSMGKLPMIDVRPFSTLEMFNQYLEIKERGKVSSSVVENYQVSEFWSIRNETLLFNWRGVEIFFEMPLDWSFEDTHPDLFQLAHHVMVEPWDKSVMQKWNPSRKAGWRPGLAFSGGVDSAAAMALMPDETVLLYNERKGIPGQLDHTNAFRFFDELEKRTGRRVYKIPSNHEKIRLAQGKSVGFSTDYACAVHVVLLADYFGLDSIGTGMPLENSYLFHGHRYRDFSTSWFWNHYSPMFSSVGLPLYQPVAGCSEIVNMEITRKNGWEGWAQSCLRSSKGGVVCGQCWKCFRKNSMLEKPFTLSNEIITFLSKKPIKQAVSTLYSIQRGGVSAEGIDIRSEFPSILPLLDLDYSFLESHHPKAFDLLPEKYQRFTESRMNHFRPKMSKKDIENLKKIDLYPNV